MTPSSSLSFPSQEIISEYLAAHPATSDSFFKINKIIEAVSQLFADSENRLSTVQISVTLTLNAVSAERNLNLSERAITAIGLKITDALSDCAAGKSLPVKKRKHNPAV